MHEGFYFSYIFKDFLIKGVDINSKWGMVQLCFGIAALAMLLELLKSGFTVCTTPYNIKSTINSQSESSSSLPQYLQPRMIKGIYHTWLYKIRKKMKSKLIYRALGSILYAGLLVLNFIVMLSVMTFNGYLMIAAVSGYVFGYFFFGFLQVPPGLASFSCSTKEDRPGYGVLTDTEIADTASQNNSLEDSTQNLEESMVTEETAPSEQLLSAQTTTTVVEVEVHPT